MEIVHGLYGSEFMENRSCGFCKHHGCHLTVKQLRQHNCLGKECWHLEKNENHQYWRQRELTKQKRKARKQMTHDYIAKVTGGV